MYGLWLSFAPKEGGALANYAHFFTTDNLYPTIWTTLKLALPATLINVGFALPIAFKMRVKTRYQRWVTTILVVPITLGTVLIAEGMLTYFGPKGWLAQFLQLVHLYDGPIRLTHNTGVLISLSSGFPFRFADPVVRHRYRSRPRARRHPRRILAQFRHIAALAGARVCFACRSCGRSGVPVRGAARLAGRPTRDSIAAYEATFEQYDARPAS
jgi:putative spermidine/putrescine transport system permease protein